VKKGRAKQRRSGDAVNEGVRRSNAFHRKLGERQRNDVPLKRKVGAIVEKIKWERDSEAARRGSFMIPPRNKLATVHENARHKKREGRYNN